MVICSHVIHYAEERAMIALTIIPLLFLAWLVFAHDHAPQGYQDTRGFHFGSLDQPAWAVAPTVPSRSSKLKEARLTGRTPQ